MFAIIFPQCFRGFCLEPTYELPRLRQEDANSLPCLQQKLASCIAERSNQAVTPAIEMLIGDWHVDEVGIMTREITARD